jgi:glycosyltransferase involved in cell wall biosynthesis
VPVAAVAPPPGLDGTGPGRVAIDARATVRAEIGGVERFALQMAAWLPRLRPDRYHVIRPHPMLAHRAGHVWEQLLFPIATARYALLYCPANLAPITSRRSVAVIHDLAALRFPQAYSRSYVAYHRLMLHALARRARLLITVSTFSKSELVDLLGVTPERIVVVPEGVEERFAPVGETERAEVAARYGLKHPYVLALGTISARKNLGLLEPAAGVLKERGIELVVAGSDRHYLRSSGSSLRRLGYVLDRDLPALYAGASALAMPSRYEGFGLPCLEAMACGTPVVASRSGALPETVGDAGLLVDADHEQEFGDALLAAAADEQLHARLSETGLRRAAGFPWSRTAELTDAALAPLLERY